jgi:hypothetical protein
MLAPLKVGKQAVVAPTIISRVPRPLIVVEGVTTNPATWVCTLAIQIAGGEVREYQSI